jgi:hypothetical protein
VAVSFSQLYFISIYFVETSQCMVGLGTLLSSLMLSLRKSCTCRSLSPPQRPSSYTFCRTLPSQRRLSAHLAAPYLWTIFCTARSRWCRYLTYPGALTACLKEKGELSYIHVEVVRQGACYRYCLLCCECVSTYPLIAIYWRLSFWGWTWGAYQIVASQSQLSSPEWRHTG